MRQLILWNRANRKDGCLELGKDLGQGKEKSCGGMRRGESERGLCLIGKR